ncbi:MAG: chorismate-binding protein [Streptosporangiaceae bacterium]
MRPGSVMRRDLPEAAGLSPAAVLRLLRLDPHPVALTGSWAGGGAVLSSAPARVVTGRVQRAAASRRPTGLAPLADVLTVPAQVNGATARFGGGWIGYLGYGFARRLHALPPAPGGPRRLPDWWFGRYDQVLVQDPDTGNWAFEALLQPDGNAERAAEARLAELRSRFQATSALGSRAADPRPYRSGDFELIPAPGQHRQAVARAVELIQAGDMFQANITLRLETTCTGDPLDVFCAGIDRLGPPYAAFLRISRAQAIASFSPELFLRRTGTTVRTSPIKGTSARSDDPAVAESQRQALAASAKNRAENVMIVDLMRSDLSRVCRPGSVIVPRLAETQAHPGVWHLVSDVRGELSPGQTDADLIAATFPPGSVTGAPKVRAMEVISELEVVPREAYTGAIGYRSPLAGLEFSVAIRTFEFAADQVWLGAGGGIVAASDPAAEYAECLVKARPLIAAIDGGSGTALPAEPAASARAEALTLWPRPAVGVFASLPVRGGKPDGLAEQLARLAASARDVYGKELPLDLAGRISDCLDGAGDGVLRITVRPVGGPLQCQLELEPDPGLAGARSPGVRLRVAALPDGMPGLGCHQWADRRLLSQLAARPGLHPGEQLLLTDAGGGVLETDRANVFAVVGGVLRTPAADGRILPGVMRARVLRAAGAARIGVAVGPLAVTELLAASELFVTNAARGLQPVIGIDGQPAGSRPAPVGSSLAAALQDWRPVNKDNGPGTGPARPDAVSRLAAVRGRASALILVIDNYDSFTYNLVHLLRTSGARLEVVRNDEVTAAQAAELGAAGLVISPGPCAPAEAGICVDVIRALGGRTPVLGVCLGHEAIAVAYGGRVERVTPVHGQDSLVEHDGLGIFAGLPASFRAARYHSLIVAPQLPAVLAVSARTSGGLPMAIRHRSDPVDGVQFHPESILTAIGDRLIGNFLHAAQPTGG